ncbi:MAG: hydrogenase maturation protease [Actinobacteria bacterium]|nr:hydrogenase maturation protease [Actinomycetota bacterium]
MAACTASSAAAAAAEAGFPTRVLCLGNDLIADDALGPMAARHLCLRLAEFGAPRPEGPAFDPAATVRAFDHPRAGTVEVVETALTGMYLLEAVVGACRLIVVDTVVTGSAPPGTVEVMDEKDFAGVPAGGSPHYVGIFEAIGAARALGLDVPAEVVIVAVEAGDYFTVGGSMTAPVRAAVPEVVDRVLALLGGSPPV